MSCNSSVKLDDFNILDYCNHSSDIRILESLFISNLMQSLNNSLSSHPLCIVKYLYLFLLIPLFYSFVANNYIQILDHFIIT